MRNHRFALDRLADILLETELFWAMPALVFTCISLVWGMNYSWVGLIIATIPFLLRRWKKGYFSQHTPFDLSVCLFLIASLVGLLVSPDWWLSLRAFQSCLASILAYYILVNISRPDYIKWGFLITGMCILMAILFAFREGLSVPPAADWLGGWITEQLQHLPQLPQLSNIISPTLRQVHGLAIAVEMVLMPLIGIILFTRQLSIRLVAILSSLPFLMCLLLFGSKGAWLAVVVASVFLMLWRYRRSLLAVSTTIGVAGIGIWGLKADWFGAFSINGLDSNLEGRWDLWQEVIEVIRDHPITGCGLGYLGHFTSTYLSPHNAYLQIYADTGILGTLAFVTALIILFKIALNLLKSSDSHPWYGFALGLLAAFLAIGVHGLFEASPTGIVAGGTDNYYYIVSPVLWILAGLLVSTQDILKVKAEGDSAVLSNKERGIGSGIKENQD